MTKGETLYKKEREKLFKENDNAKLSKTQQEKLKGLWLQYDRNAYIQSQDFHIDKCLDLIEEIKFDLNNNSL